MPRPPTARGAGLDHASPLLRPHQSGFSHSVTPSPTFPGQEVRDAPRRPQHSEVENKEIPKKYVRGNLNALQNEVSLYYSTTRSCWNNADK